MKAAAHRKPSVTPAAMRPAAAIAVVRSALAAAARQRAKSLSNIWRPRSNRASASPGRSDDKADRHRDRDCRDWPLLDDILQRLLQGGRRLLRCARDAARPLGGVGHDGIDV